MKNLEKILEYIAYLSQLGLFICAVYIFKEDKKRKENIMLYNLCINLTKTAEYVCNWKCLLDRSSFTKINDGSVSKITELYITYGNFVNKYNCEHEKIEKSLGLLSIRYAQSIFFIENENI